MNANSLPEQNAPVPEGVYKVGISKIKKDVGKNSGVAYLNIDLVIQDGEYKGRHVFDIISLSPNALWKLKEYLIALREGNTELPITMNPDGAMIVDESGVYGVICQVSRGALVNVFLSIRPENKEKSLKARNEVKEYILSDSIATKGWAE